LWQGTPFADICELTDVPEGLIVRTIVRLDETCREFKNAAAIMGNSALYKKMETASNAIKRDIVFAASLYVTECNHFIDQCGSMERHLEKHIWNSCMYINQRPAQCAEIHQIC
jgi:hypothetical protein